MLSPYGWQKAYHLTDAGIGVITEVGHTKTEISVVAKNLFDTQYTTSINDFSNNAPVGYDGIAPTIRLKALRDGIEDFEYLSILQRQGKAAEAQKIVRSLTESFFQWEKDPAAYESARTRLAALISAPDAQR